MTIADPAPEATPAPSKVRSLAAALLLACALAVVQLAIATSDVLGAITHLASDAVTAPLIDQVRSSPVVMGRIGVFAVVVLVLYLAMGMAAWLLTRLTIAALPSLQHRRLWLIAGWFLFFSAATGLANAELFPWSRAARWSRAAAEFVSAPIPLWAILVAMLAASVSAMAVSIALRRRWLIQLLRAGIWAVVVVMAILTWSNLQADANAASGNRYPDRPDIVLIGIDSLRPELVGDARHIGYMPALSRFVNSGHRFTDATTPLARTFPAWMALLTGQRPTTSGIRENLMPRAGITVDTVPQMLGRHGYQTVYATDEVRFSNIDASYGFSSVLTPRIGASDFLVGSLADFPLTNLIANTWLGGWLLPDIHANRAAAVTYDPFTFVKRLDRQLTLDERPVLLAMHLTLPHHPYLWRADNDAVFADSSDVAYAYLSAVVEVDRQYAAIMQMLERKGLLENAMVFVFSDHGEALNLAADTRGPFEALHAGVEGAAKWSAGHGNTVLTGGQYEILMAARRYGAVGDAASRGVHDDPVSIEDLAPTVLEVAGLAAEVKQQDGRSFAARLNAVETLESLPKAGLRIRFTESAYTTPSLQRGIVDEVALMKEGAGLFRLNPDTGWVESRDEMLTLSLAMRERAAIGKERLLAALPGSEPGTSSYVLMSRSGGGARKLTGRPDPIADSEAAELWDALATEFAGELGRALP